MTLEMTLDFQHDDRHWSAAETTPEWSGSGNQSSQLTAHDIILRSSRDAVVHNTDGYYMYYSSDASSIDRCVGLSYTKSIIVTCAQASCHQLFIRTKGCSRHYPQEGVCPHEDIFWNCLKHGMVTIVSFNKGSPEDVWLRVGDILRKRIRNNKLGRRNIGEVFGFGLGNNKVVWTSMVLNAMFYFCSILSCWD